MRGNARLKGIFARSGFVSGGGGLRGPPGGQREFRFPVFTYRSKYLYGKSHTPQNKIVPDDAFLPGVRALWPQLSRAGRRLSGMAPDFQAVG